MVATVHSALDCSATNWQSQSGPILKTFSKDFCLKTFINQFLVRVLLNLCVHFCNVLRFANYAINMYDDDGDGGGEDRLEERIQGIW